MIIFSINVHEKIIFLLKQIQNIEKYVKVKYKIIINPNSYMFNEITKNNFIQNFYLKNTLIYLYDFGTTIKKVILASIKEKSLHHVILQSIKCKNRRLRLLFLVNHHYNLDVLSKGLYG